jgi:Lar family restriction alleviation protein
MTDKPKLAPCPFCGDENAEAHFTTMKGFLVFCAQCGAVGPTTRRNHLSSLPASLAREAAEAAWNKRFTPPMVPVETPKLSQLKITFDYKLVPGLYEQLVSMLVRRVFAVTDWSWDTPDEQTIVVTGMMTSTARLRVWSELNKERVSFDVKLEPL